MQWGGYRGWELLGASLESSCPRVRRACRLMAGVQPGLAVVLAAGRIESPASSRGSQIPSPATSTRSFCGSFTSHSLCTRTVGITSVYSYPATKHSDIALCCYLFEETEGLGLRLGWFRVGGVKNWVLLPFLLIHLFRKEKKIIRKQGGTNCKYTIQ